MLAFLSVLWGIIPAPDDLDDGNGATSAAAPRKARRVLVRDLDAAAAERDVSPSRSRPP